MWAVSLGVVGVKAFGMGENKCLAAAAKSEKLMLETRELAQQGAAEAIAKLIPVNRTIVQKVQHEIQTNTVYAECKHTPGGLLRINEALTGRANPASGSELPRTNPP